MMTLPEVFIIESLSYEDEEAGRFEGQIISGILNLGGKQSEYHYIRTTKELEKFVDVLDIIGKFSAEYHTRIVFST